MPATQVEIALHICPAPYTYYPSRYNPLYLPTILVEIALHICPASYTIYPSGNCPSPLSHTIEPERFGGRQGWIVADLA